VPLPERAPEREGVTVTVGDGLTLVLPTGEREREGLAEAEREGEGDAVAETEARTEGDAVALPVGEGMPPGLPLAVGDAAPRAAVTLTMPVVEEERDAVTVTEGKAVGRPAAGRGQKGDAGRARVERRGGGGVARG
jgi:hypothetical protein